MTTAATSLLGLALPVTGELSGTWGDTVNNSITALLDSAVAGTTTLSADVDVTLTTTTLAANQAREAIILWTAAGTVTRYITAPAQSKIYAVLNKSSTQSIVLRGVGPTTGVTILAGKQAMVAWDGTDYVEISSGYVDGPATSTDNAVARFDGTDGKLLQNSVVIIADTTGNMTGVGTLSSGAITSSSLTATRVLFAGTSGLIQDDADLTFNGTILTSTGFAGPLNGTVGATTANTGAFTDLSFSGTGTFSGGTANGVTYLNGSKVLTSGTALTFDGANLGVGGYINSGNGNSQSYGGYANGGRIFALQAAGTTGAALAGATDTTANSVAIRAYTKEIANDTSYAFDIQTGNGTGVTTQKLQLTWSANGLWNSTGLAVTGTLSSTLGALIQGLTVGRGAGAVATNTAVGASALAANTSGNNNVGIGNQALQLNTTGTSNVMVGSVAGYNSSGTLNIGVGYQAVRNASGNHNVGVGGSALVTTTSGGFNTAIGSEALYSNTTASNNTAVGYQAGYTNTTGGANTLLGKAAGYSASGASDNTLIGYEAGNATTGGSSTFVGTRAGALITSGVKNTILGRYDGNQGGLDIRTASNYIVLSDGDGNPRGVFDNNGYFYVGTTSPVYNARIVVGCASGTQSIAFGVGSGVTRASGTQYGYTLYQDNTTETSAVTFVENNASGNNAASYVVRTNAATGGTGVTNVSGGVALVSGATSWSSYSDLRLKHDVVPVTNAIESILKIDPIFFKWNDRPEDQQRSIGVSAQSVEKVFPELIDRSGIYDVEGGAMQVRYTELIPVLLAAIKEQQSMIEDLKTRLAAAGI